MLRCIECAEQVTVNRGPGLLSPAQRGLASIQEAVPIWGLIAVFLFAYWRGAVDCKEKQEKPGG
jgi:hypothetical protein